MLPEELVSKVDIAHINLPWGTLLQTVATPNAAALKKIVGLLRTKGTLKIIFGYTQEAEPSEIERLELENISLDHIKEELLPKYEGLGLKNTLCMEVKKGGLREIESTWGKKLAFGQERPVFHLEFRKT